MKNIIPIYYSEYGRYINKFRHIPSYIDGLKFVERRLLLTLHEVARKELTGSAEIVGYALKYHPHGDASIYKSLVGLVEQGYAVRQGNWGSQGMIEDDPPAHFRYTETKLEKWVEELAFEYIDYVPWEEFEKKLEPIYLPCPLPIGLIGRDIITGITFYKTTIPKFKISDLAKRLQYLLKKEGPNVEIFPTARNCDIQETSPNQMNSILTKGIGTLTYSPWGKLESKSIRIQGRSPLSSFDSLYANVDKLEIDIRDATGSESNGELDGVIEPRKKNTDLKELGLLIWNKYLIKKINFNCLFCNEEGTVATYGIDQILINNYNFWKQAVKLKRIDEYNKLSNKKVELMIVQIIRYIFETYKSNKIEEVINKYHELKKTTDVSIEIDVFDVALDKWSKEIKQITDQNIIEICNKRTIKNLVETVIDTQKVENDLVTAKFLIDNIEKNCFDYIIQLKDY